MNGTLSLGKQSTGRGTYNLSDSATLSTDTTRVGNFGTGTFNQAGGTHNVNTLWLAAEAGSSGTYTLSGGALNVGKILSGQGTSTFNLDGGDLNLTASSLAIGNFNIGSNAYYAKTTTVANAMVNLGGFDINRGVTLTVNGSLDNSGQMKLYGGGRMTGAGTLTNNADFTVYGGTISGSGGFVNNGQLHQLQSAMTLSNTGDNVNNGNWDLGGKTLTLSGATLTNAGLLSLNAGLVNGTGALVNGDGGVIEGKGTINATFKNNGVLLLTGGVVNVTTPFTSAGLIQIGSLTANLAGGVLTNLGTVQGFGTVGSALVNRGTVEAVGGSLVLGGKLTNTVDGLIAAGTGSKVLVTQGLVANAGTISLTGGTFDNNGKALANSGQISGFGGLRSGGLTNTGSVHFTGGGTTVNGNVTNAVGASLQASYNPVTFTGNVVNDGLVKTTATTVTFTGSFTNNGTYLSDPATQVFQNLTIGTQGALQGGAGDVFVINGNLVNNSQAKATFDISAAKVKFTGGSHGLTWSASNLGSGAAGYQNNFAVGTFELAIGATLTFMGGSASALYVHELLLDGGVSQLASIQSGGASIYYDPMNAANRYLLGKTYALGGAGGMLIAAAVPEPQTYLLFLAGLGWLGWARGKIRRAGMRDDCVAANATGRPLSMHATLPTGLPNS